jgi:hypothetical protein
MKLLTKKHALALLLASGAVASASLLGVAGCGQSSTTPLAGPWYTPQELKALIAYSNASLAQKKAILAGRTAASVATNRALVLAGPRYTPRELTALVAYSNASFAQKKAILAGAEPSRIPTENGLLVYEARVGKHYQLFTINADGSGAHQLTHFSDSDAVWALPARCSFSHG